MPAGRSLSLRPRLESSRTSHVAAAMVPRLVSPRKHTRRRGQVESDASFARPTAADDPDRRVVVPAGTRWRRRRAGGRRATRRRTPGARSRRTRRLLCSIGSWAPRRSRRRASARRRRPRPRPRDCPNRRRRRPSSGLRKKSRRARAARDDASSPSTKLEGRPAVYIDERAATSRPRRSTRSGPRRSLRPPSIEPPATSRRRCRPRRTSSRRPGIYREPLGTTPKRARRGLRGRRVPTSGPATDPDRAPSASASGEAAGAFIHGKWPSRCLFFGTRRRRSTLRAVPISSTRRRPPTMPRGIAWSRRSDVRGPVSSTF